MTDHMKRLDEIELRPEQAKAREAKFRAGAHHAVTTRDDTIASVERLNGVEGIEAELVHITAEEWEAMHD